MGYGNTIEAEFEYQIKEALKTMYEEMLDEEDETSFESYVWDNKDRLGELMFEATNEWLGYDYFENFKG